jgi:peroxiredoxin
LADYRDLYNDIRKTGADVAAVAVDPPKTSAAVRKQLALPFSVLCDTKREIVRPWGVYNTAEKGGIAEAAVFIVDREGILRFVSVDTMTSRVAPATVVGYLRAGMPETSDALPRNKLKLKPKDLGRAVRNAIKFRVRSPRK